MSTLTIAELVAGPRGVEQDLKRVRRQSHLRYVQANVESISFDLRCARAYGSIYGATVRAGRKPRGSRAIDLPIAATALADDLPLYTLNVKDLRGLEDLIEIVDVGA